MLVKREFTKKKFRYSKEVGDGRGGEYHRYCYGYFLFGFIPIYLYFGNWVKL